jgi:vacuole membrane protein 1
VQDSSHGKPKGWIQRTMASIQRFMMYIIQRFGFWGILTLASWPNAAFDLCGICCGAFKMPFMQFFGATLIGKGVIKVTGQSIFFVSLFRKVRTAL